MSRALPGLTGVATVHTTAFERAQFAMADAARLNDIAVLSGTPGCGKTYAVEQFLASADMQGRRATFLEMPPHPARKEVSWRLMRALTGSTNLRQPEYVLIDELDAQLSGSGDVVVLDEAHHLGTGGLQKMRYLHQRGQFTWALILVGSEIAQTLRGAGEMRSRVNTIVRFEPLREAELLATVRALHPLLNKSTPKALRYVDQEYARGRMREWSRFLRAALELAPLVKASTLTDELISAALATVGSDGWGAA